MKKIKLERGSGGWYARKRIPDAVRDEFRRLYGQRHEAKFFAKAATPEHEAHRLFHEWLADVEGRIAAILAAQKGEGVSLTHRQARALAGEWYQWFVERHPVTDEDRWLDLLGHVQDALRAHASTAEEAEHVDDFYKDHPQVREAIRPLLADIGETAQFLALKRMALNNEARALFLDNLYEDLAAALRRLIRRSRGDYSPDAYVARSPKFEGPDSGLTPWQLFELWVDARQPARGTVESWKYVLTEMGAHFQSRSAASSAWIKGLISRERSAATVKRTWLNASKTVFDWAVEQRHLRENVFAGVRVTVPKQPKLRPTQAFTADETRTILKAALSITDTERPLEAAKRWAPWLCAYTGARPGEITQLRVKDVIESEGVHALRITPEAGTVKNKQAREVPIHEHLIEQGFLAFVARRKQGPLFYNPPELTEQPEAGLLKQRKPRYVQANQRLAAWVRSLGVNDTALSPNHAWRHTFKQIADHAQISERMSDYITGHAHRSAGAGYGAPTLTHMAEALKRFPRYAV